MLKVKRVDQIKSTGEVIEAVSICPHKRGALHIGIYFNDLAKMINLYVSKFIYDSSVWDIPGFSCHKHLR